MPKLYSKSLHQPNPDFLSKALKELNIILFGIFMLFSLIQLNCNAQIFYVDNGNPISNDTNPGTQQLPWLTIHKANRTVLAGDTVIVKAGIYHDWIGPYAAGTYDYPITYISEPYHAAVLDGWIHVDSVATDTIWQQVNPDTANIWKRELISSAFTEAWMDDTVRFGFPFPYTCDTLHFEQGRSYIDSTGMLYVWLPEGETPDNHSWHVTLKSGIWLLNNNGLPRDKYVSAEGFTVQNYGLSGISVNVDYVKISNCISQKNGRAGIAVAFCNHVLIEDNIASENCIGIGFSQGITAYSVYGTDIVFRRNISHHNYDGAEPEHCGSDGNGFVFDTSPPGSGATFINNVAYNNMGAGFGVYQSSNGIFINNTSFNNNLKTVIGGECHIIGTAEYPSNHLLFRNNIFAGGRGSDRSSLHIKYSWANPPVDVKFDHNLYYRQNADEDSKLFELTFKCNGGEEHLNLNISEFQNLSLSSGDTLFEPHWGEGSFVANPVLTDWQTGGFSLPPDSPAIDNGNEDSAPHTDFYGTLRPQGKGYDMGAYEFSTSGIKILNGNDEKTMSLKAFPNPFKHYTTIVCGVSKTSDVNIFITDMFGKSIKRIHFSEQTGRLYKIIWNGTDVYGNRVKSGLYFINMQTGSAIKTIKVLLID